MGEAQKEVDRCISKKVGGCSSLKGWWDKFTRKVGGTIANELLVCESARNVAIWSTHGGWWTKLKERLVDVTQGRGGGC